MYSMLLGPVSCSIGCFDRWDIDTFITGLLHDASVRLFYRTIAIRIFIQSLILPSSVETFYLGIRRCRLATDKLTGASNSSIDRNETKGFIKSEVDQFGF